MRIAICDDEKYFRDVLKNELEFYFKEKATDFVYDEFNSGSALLKSTRTYDLIFMDYQMDELNGMDTARQLRERNNKTVIIFLTSYPDIVFDTFEVNAFRFLVKPVNRKKLYKALDDYFKVFSEDEYLILNCPNITAVNFNDIIYVEAQNKTCVIHTVDGKIEYSRLLAEVEKKLPEDRFFKCHRAFIIGLKHVKGRDGRDVIFHNGQKADIAVKKYTLFKERLITYMKKYVFDVNTGGEVE